MNTGTPNIHFHEEIKKKSIELPGRKKCTFSGAISMFMFRSNKKNMCVSGYMEFHYRDSRLENIFNLLKKFI